VPLKAWLARGVIALGARNLVRLDLVITDGTLHIGAHEQGNRRFNFFKKAVRTLHSIHPLEGR
jgi:hypothetical protein